MAYIQSVSLASTDQYETGPTVLSQHLWLRPLRALPSVLSLLRISLSPGTGPLLSHSLGSLPSIFCLQQTFATPGIGHPSFFRSVLSLIKYLLKIVLCFLTMNWLAEPATFDSEFLYGDFRTLREDPRTEIICTSRTHTDHHNLHKPHTTQITGPSRFDSPALEEHSLVFEVALLKYNLYPLNFILGA